MNGLEALALIRPLKFNSYQDASSSDWAKVLATVPLFSGINQRRLRKLVRKATIIEFAAHDRVFSSEGGADFLYVILGGTAKAIGKPAARTLAVGDYFGELAPLARSPRTAAVVATQELHVMRFPWQSVLQLAGRHPAITLRMLANVSVQLQRLETQDVRSG
jgi:CRP-like cAMP-binding protein